MHFEMTATDNFSRVRLKQCVLRWGIRYVVRAKFMYNPTWRTSSYRIVEVLSEEPVVNFEFRMPAIEAYHFGPDRRSFIDGQAFICDAVVCKTIDDAIDKGAPFDLVMRFGPTPGVAPIAVQVEPVAKPVPPP